MLAWRALALDLGMLVLEGWTLGGRERHMIQFLLCSFFDYVHGYGGVVDSRFFGAYNGLAFEAQA